MQKKPLRDKVDFLDVKRCYNVENIKIVYN